MSEDKKEEILIEDSNQESLIEIQIYERTIDGSETERNGRNPSTGETIKIRTNLTEKSTLGASININL